MNKPKPVPDGPRLYILDRYYFSTMAYGCVYSQDMIPVEHWNIDMPKPDVVIWLDIPAGIATSSVEVKLVKLLVILISFSLVYLQCDNYIHIYHYIHKTHVHLIDMPVIFSLFTKRTHIPPI